jgi:hypothetical protein
LALSGVILSIIACSLLNNPTTDAIGEQLGNLLQDQIQDALQLTGNEELFDKIGDAVGEFTSGEWTRADVPLPPAAEVIGAFMGEGSDGDFVLLETSMNIDDAEKWLTESLGTNGWIQGDTQIDFADSRVLDFSKGSEGLAVVMNSSVSSGTTVSVTVFSKE